MYSTAVKTLLMGCVRVSGAPDGTRWLPETTLEVFSWTRSCEPAAQYLAKSLIFSIQGALVLWLRRRWKHGFRQKFSSLQMDIFLTYPTKVPESTDREIVFPWGVESYWPENAPKGLRKKDWISLVFIRVSFSEFSETPEFSTYGCSLRIPCAISESFVFVAETPTRTRAY